jgi:P-type Cu+ transporter
MPNGSLTLGGGGYKQQPGATNELPDVVSLYFVPAVIVTAVMTFLAWSLFGPEPRLANALINAVAVLIIACP